MDSTTSGETERLVLQVRLRKDLRKLLELLKETGFTNIRYTPAEVRLERVLPGEKADLDYRITLGKKSIVLEYPIPSGQSRSQRSLEVLPVFLNVLALVETQYDIQSGPLFQSTLSLLEDLSRHRGKDAAELASEVDEFRRKHAGLQKKYEDLVRASEENARILLECERRRDELHKRVDQLEGMSNEALKQALFDWIKVHGGSLEVQEFARAHGIATPRVEEGLQLLIQEGYIKRRSEL